AFKAITPDGLGTDIKGTVIDEAGVPVCTFATAHLGMGAFNFVPEESKIYKTQITYADGTTNIVDLPQSTKTGYTISLNNTDPDSIKLRVTAGNGSPMDKLSLVAQSGGIIYYVAENQSGNKLFSAIIPKYKFPTGIVQFTLFSAAGEPLNERLAFINNNDQLKLAVAAKECYTPRQKVEIRLNVKDKNSKPVTAGSFSVSVTDETKMPVNEPNENTILSDLLLTSELKGTVEQPNYYFTNVNEKTNAGLDLLMLTQGYRHFSWKQVLNDSPMPVAYHPQKALEISGSAKTGGGKPISGAMVTLFTKSGGPFLIDTLTDTNGKFSFPNLTFGDSVKFVVQAKVAKGQNNVVLNLDSIAAPAIANIKNRTSHIFPVDASAYLANQRFFYLEQQKYGINKHAVLLKEVTVKGRKIEPVWHSENLNGSGSADQVLTVKELEKMNCEQLSDCLSGVLTGVTIRHPGAVDGGLPLNQRAHQAVMAVVLDGMLLDNSQAYEELNYHLHAEDIEGIEVITGTHYGAIYGSAMANGGLIITTKRGRKTDNYERYAPGVITYMPKGYYKAREFYSPQYDNPKTNKQTADRRSTIFWKPDIITDKDGVASFQYFNADGKGTYRVVIEGIDADGNLGRQVYRYKVE
ncbi:MAG: TonB-dependent receptor plug domain-containing protein, partial [Mucilaginibacter sp.]